MDWNRYNQIVLLVWVCEYKEFIAYTNIKVVALEGLTQTKS